MTRQKPIDKPVEDFEKDPLPNEAYRPLHPSANPPGQWHMANFVDSIDDDTTTITDVATHHRGLSVCHAATIAMPLGWTLTFDLQAQRLVDDDQTNGFVARQAGAGFETDV